MLRLRQCFTARENAEVTASMLADAETLADYVYDLATEPAPTAPDAERLAKLEEVAKTAQEYVDNIAPSGGAPSSSSSAPSSYRSKAASRRLRNPSWPISR